MQQALTRLLHKNIMARLLVKPADVLVKASWQAETTSEMILQMAQISCEGEMHDERNGKERGR